MSLNAIVDPCAKVEAQEVELERISRARASRAEVDPTAAVCSERSGAGCGDERGRCMGGVT